MEVPLRLFLSLSCGILQDKWCIQWQLERSAFQLGCTTMNNVPWRSSGQRTWDNDGDIRFGLPNVKTARFFNSISRLKHRWWAHHTYTTHICTQPKKREGNAGSNTEASRRLQWVDIFLRSKRCVQTKGNLTSWLALAKSISSSGGGSLPKGSDTRLMLQLTGLKKHLTDP